MARPSPASPALRRTAVVTLVAAGVLALPTAATAGPTPVATSVPTAKAAALAQPTACTPRESKYATASTASPLAVEDLGDGTSTISARGSVGGHTTRSITSVTVFLDGEYVGRAALSKAQPFSFVVAAQPRSWSLDVPAGAGSHDLLVCSNSSYGSLAGVSTPVEVPVATSAPTPTPSVTAG